MKKKIMFVVLTVTLLLVLFSACKPHYCTNNVLNVGEACEIYEDYNEHLCTVIFNSCTMETIKEEEEILVIYNTTIQPKKTFKVESKDFLLEVGFEERYTDEEKRKTSASDNIRINGYDIFEIVLSKETIYSFCYHVPYEKNDIKYYETSFNLLVFHNYALFYYFEI